MKSGSLSGVRLLERRPWSLPETSVAGGDHDGFYGLTWGHVDIHGPRCCVDWGARLWSVLP